jgi:hypothetical protein
VFAIKDLESIKNLAAILVIPFFAAAYVSENASNTFRDSLFNSVNNIEVTAIKLLGYAGWLLFVVFIAMLLFAILDAGIVWIHIKTYKTFFMPIIGFTCLTVGIFVLSFAWSSLPKSPLNPFWHIALICYGFTLVDRSADQPTST